MTDLTITWQWLVDAGLLAAATLLAGPRVPDPRARLLLRCGRGGGGPEPVLV